MAYAEAVRRADRTFGRAEDALGDVRDSLRQAGDRLRQTRQELATIREQLQAQPFVVDGQAIARKAAEAALPLLVEARQKLLKATEAGLVLEGLLDALAELPLGERVGIEPERLRDASDRLGELIGRSELLAATLEKTASVLADESWRLIGPLDRIIAATDAGADRADAARERVRAWHARVIYWLTVAAVGVTVLLAWIGLGQLSLLVHGYAGRADRGGHCIRTPASIPASVGADGANVISPCSATAAPSSRANTGRRPAGSSLFS